VVDVVRSVDVHGLVGVDTDAHLSDVGVDQSCGVPGLQVGQEAVHVDLRKENKVSDSDLERVRTSLMVLIESCNLDTYD
jgi:hypothetical protein